MSNSTNKRRAFIERNPGYETRKSREWRARNPERCAEYREKYRDKSRAYEFNRRLRRRGISQVEYDAFIVSQANACAICRIPFDNPKKTHIDHDHNTGKVRGLLCHRCNRALGMFRDDEGILRNAVIYLQSVLLP